MWRPLRPQHCSARLGLNRPTDRYQFTCSEQKKCTCVYCGQILSSRPCSADQSLQSQVFQVLCEIACSACLNLRGDDYDVEEFASLRNQVRQLAESDLCRRSTSDSQRVLLENSFARSCFPHKREVSQLRRVLGWPRDRILKWFANKRAFPNRVPCNKRSTTDEQRCILEAAFASNPDPDFPSANHFGSLLGWSPERVIKWFRNKRNYRARQPKRHLSELELDTSSSDLSSSGSEYSNRRAKRRRSEVDASNSDDSSAGLSGSE